MHRTFFALIACVFVAPAFGLTDASKAELEKLIKSMRTEAAAGKDSEENLRHAESFIAQLEKLKDADSPVLLQQTLNQYAGYFKSKEVAAGLAALGIQLDEERKKGDTEEEKRLEALIKKAEEIVKRAKEPAELDEIIAELSRKTPGEYRIYNGDGRVSENMRMLVAAIEPTRSFLERWQDYLAGMKANDPNAARQALGDLRHSNRNAGLLPRSEVLAKLQELSYSRDEAVKMVVGIRSLEEIGPVIEFLQTKEKESSGNAFRALDVIVPLAEINKSYKEYQAGMPIAVGIDFQNYNQLPQELATKIVELRSTLLMLVLPRYVGAPDDVKAAPGDSLFSFLDKMEAEAKERQDAPLGARIKDARRIFARGTSFSTQDMTGLNAYVSAKNQETAGQYELAVLSYQLSLKSGSDLVPAKLIGERLDAIKKSHPVEFEEGMERFHASAFSSPSPYGPVNPRPGSMREDPMRKVAPTLLIPAPEVGKPDAAPGDAEKK